VTVLGLRADAAAVAAVLGGLYAVGWWRLARRSAGSARLLAAPPPSGWRLGAALVGLAALGVALSEPVDRAAHARFSAHMLQHLLLVTVAAPALLLADPCPRLLWALPRALRRRVGGWLAPAAAPRRLLRRLTSLPAAWLLSNAVLWLWHLPAAYDAALERGALHDLEHLGLYAAALLFWWPILRPAPRVRPAPAPGSQVAYLVLGAVANAALGLLFVLLPVPVYPTYAAAMPFEAALEDQVQGGLWMWGWGGAVDMLAVLLVVHRVLRAEAPRPPLGAPGPAGVR
jgi:cytochrome c oxidase assembly factor CtaG